MITIEPLTEHADPGDIRWVASRMRLTLVEVLGRERGEAMYDMDWLVDRVHFHLDRTRSCGAAFVAREPDGTLVGHTIVRVEEPQYGEAFGLFSTTWVAPETRRRGVASRLLDAGEAWMRDMGMAAAATHTAADNDGLIALYERRGYAIDMRRDDMVRLRRPLG